MKNKSFFILFSTVSFILIIALTALSILGNKERIGYITDFKLLEENNSKTTDFIYSMRIRYYDKVFRNSDIYGVYAVTNNLPEYIKSISFEKSGSPFGRIISEKEIKYDEKIDVVYKLKVKSGLILYYIIFLLIILLLFAIKLSFSYRQTIYNFFVKLYMNSKLVIDKLAIVNCNKIFHIVLPFIIVFIILIVFLKRPYISSWDSINYIANGLSLLNFGKQLMTYPGTLFSIINTFLANLIFKNTQLSSFAYLQIIPLSITVIFTYKLLRIFISKNASIIFLLFIFIVYSPLYLISDMLIQPHTDGWLLMFCVLVAYLVLKEKVLLAGILVGISHYYRASQAIPILVFAIVLLPKFNIKKIVVYYTSIIISFLLIHFILNAVFNFPSKDTDFYVSFANRLPFTALNIKDIFLDIINVVVAFKASTIPIAISLIISLIGFIKIKDNNLRKLAIFAVLVSAICFAGGITIQKIFGSREETLKRIGENRYFIYALLFSTISAFIYLYGFFKKNKYFLLNILRNIAVLFIIIGSLYISVNTIKKINNFNNIITYSNYSNDYPEIEPNASYTIAEIMEGGAFNYILKNGQKYNGNYRTIENFLKDDNSKFNYVLSTHSLADTDEITDNSGIRFVKIWQSSLSNSRPYCIFKKIDE